MEVAPFQERERDWRLSCGWLWPAIELVSLFFFYFFFQRVRFFFFSFATLREEPCVCVFLQKEGGLDRRERERETIHLHTGGPALAQKPFRSLSLYFSFFFFLCGLVLSFFLSLRFPLLGSPLCYEVSVTRFAHIQFGPCRRAERRNGKLKYQKAETIFCRPDCIRQFLFCPSVDKFCFWRHSISIWKNLFFR